MGQAAPLHLAAFSGQHAVLTLLQHGADLRAKDSSGMTPLHVAVFHSHESSSRLLVEYGADVNAKDMMGRTPLHLAANEGNEANCRLLLENGAGLLDRTDEEGMTAEDVATVQLKHGVAAMLRAEAAHRTKGVAGFLAPGVRHQSSHDRIQVSYPPTARKGTVYECGVASRGQLQPKRPLRFRVGS